MSEHDGKNEVRTIHESGRAGDLPWKATIEYDGDKSYTITRVAVDGKPIDRPINNPTQQSLQDALVEVRLMVTGANPLPPGYGR